MSKILEFSISGEPKAKQRPQFSALNRSGFTPTQTLNYEAYAKWFIYQKWDKGELIRWEEHEPLFMFCTSYHSLPKSKRKQWENSLGFLFHTSKPDKDNVAKIIMDCMNKLVFPDDAQIVGGLDLKRYAPPGALPEVRVKIQSVYTIPFELLKCAL